MQKKKTARMYPSMIKTQNDGNSNYAGVDELWANERFLANYNLNIINRLSKHSEEDANILEFGAGLGTLSNIWLTQKKNRPECVEIDPYLRGVLIDRGFLCYKNLDDIKKEYDTIFTSNVLEHIEDDVNALKKLNSKIKINGILAIYVPAFMLLFNELDASVGHYRRYRKKDLKKKLLDANFKIKECYYVDSIGFFAWLLIKLKGYDCNNKLGSNNNLKIYDKYLYPISSFLDDLGLKHVFGKNLLVIAQKL